MARLTQEGARRTRRAVEFVEAMPKGGEAPPAKLNNFVAAHTIFVRVTSATPTSGRHPGRIQRGYDTAAKTWTEAGADDCWVVTHDASVLAATRYLTRLMGILASDGLAVFMAEKPDAAAGGSFSIRKNSTGTVFTRSQLNVIEGSEITLTLADDAGTPENDLTIARPFYGFRATQSSVQSVSGGATVSVLFDTELYDVTGWHSTASDTHKFVTPVAGYYHLSATVKVFGTGSSAAHDAWRAALRRWEDGFTHYVDFGYVIGTLNPAYEDAALVVSGDSFCLATGTVPEHFILTFENRSGASMDISCDIKGHRAGAA